VWVRLRLGEMGGAPGCTGEGVSIAEVDALER